MTNITQVEDSSANIAIVIGASSEIATALVHRLSRANASTNIVAISRQFSATASADFDSNVRLLQSDYTDKSIRKICEQLKPHKGKISHVFICNGILHDADVSPEKRVDDVSGDNLHRVFQVNAVIPMLWVKYLKPVLAGNGNCVVTAFSARIGSIEDNQS